MSGTERTGESGTSTRIKIPFDVLFFFPLRLPFDVKKNIDKRIVECTLENINNLFHCARHSLTDLHVTMICAPFREET